MSRYYDYPRYRHDYKPWKQFVAPILVGIAVVLALAWLIAENCNTRTFIGSAVNKEISYSYSYDDENDRMKGSKSYTLTFYSEGEMRTTLVSRFTTAFNSFSRNEGRAKENLDSESVEPAEYTHAKINTEYLVTVRGWLLDGSLLDMTPMSAIKAE